jgi:hypothetical protein
MLPTLNDQSRLSTGEIHDERTDRNLSSEMRTNQHNVTPKALPEHTLGIGRLGAHPMRKFSLANNHRAGFNHIRSRLWTPTPNPSPQGGGVNRRAELD